MKWKVTQAKTDVAEALVPRDFFVAGPPGLLTVPASLFLDLDTAPVGACFFLSQPSNGLACFRFGCEVVGVSWWLLPSCFCRGRKERVVAPGDAGVATVDLAWGVTYCSGASASSWWIFSLESSWGSTWSSMSVAASSSASLAWLFLDSRLRALGKSTRGLIDERVNGRTLVGIDGSIRSGWAARRPRSSSSSSLWPLNASSWNLRKTFLPRLKGTSVRKLPREWWSR